MQSFVSQTPRIKPSTRISPIIRPSEPKRAISVMDNDFAFMHEQDNLFSLPPIYEDEDFVQGGIRRSNTIALDGFASGMKVNRDKDIPDIECEISEHGINMQTDKGQINSSVGHFEGQTSQEEV